MGDLKRLAQNAILVQARARLESVSIEPIILDPERGKSRYSIASIHEWMSRLLTVGV